MYPSKTDSIESDSSENHFANILTTGLESTRLYSLIVKNVRKLTNDSAVITFDIPEIETKLFRYIQGQYVSLVININGTEYRREYSICSSPYTGEDFAIAVRLAGTSTVSRYLIEDLKPGDIVKSYPPGGNFYTLLSPENKKTYVLIGGGSGITPLISIAKSVMYVEPQSKVILYFGNSGEKEIMFRSELENMATRDDKFRLLLTLSHPPAEWNGLTGKINKKEIDSLLAESGPEENTEFFICGPQAMMELVRSALAEKEVPADKIHIEYFTPLPSQGQNQNVAVDEMTGVDRKVRIIIDDEEHEITVPAGGVILDAAIEADLDPPFSCRSGICTTCRAKLRSGKVKMDVSEGLTPDEIREGYILTCQSHPVTDDVVAEYE